MLIRHSYNSHF